MRETQILFVTATRLGDAVLSTGILAHLLARHPGAAVTIAAGPVAAPLFEAVPNLKRLIVVEKRRFALHWLGLLAALAPTRWDLVVDLRRSALAYLLRAGERRISAKARPDEHRLRNLARLFDIEPPAAPRLWLAPEHERQAAALVGPGEALLAIGPAANWRAKQWRAERFAELAQRLTAPGGLLAGARVAVMAAAHERAQAAPLLEALPASRRLDLVGGLDLLGLAAVLRRASLFIGNDSGLMHMAAAAGAPTLGLFGPSPAAEYAPWGERCAVVQTAIPRPRLFGPGYHHLTTDTLMDSLSVDMAEAGAAELWRRIGGKAA
jgi:ADP-heptose:LPS heptosyltransferase